MTPELHATLLRASATIVIVMSAVILTRHSLSPAGRGHALYGATVAGWLLAMSMVAEAPTLEVATTWSRWAMLAVCLLPGVVYQLNTETAGVAQERRRETIGYHAASVAIAMVGAGTPLILAEPQRYWWGYFPRFTAWGALPVGLLMVCFVDALRLYRGVMRRWGSDSGHSRRARVFYRGNFVAYLAALDFLPAFGIASYPFGYAIVVVMFTSAVLAAIRYRLIEITPEIAAPTLLDGISDAVVVADPLGTVRLANRAAAGLLAREQHDLLNQPLAAFATDRALADALTIPPRHDGRDELTFVDGSGRRRVAELRCSRIDDRWHEPLAWVWLLRDLTDQRRAEREKAALERWLHQSQRMESLAVLAGGVAHQFNNVLMTIVGRVQEAQASQRDGGSPDAALEAISSAVDRAAAVSQQLLVYAGRHPADHGAVDLNALVRDLAERLRAAAGPATVVARLRPDLPSCAGDRRALADVLLSLVTNAGEAVGDRAGTIHVVTGVAEPAGAATGARVFVEVRDDGPGIAAEIRDRIFDPFFTTKFEGRGLGLALVQRTVAAHGGRIVVGPANGPGACVRVELPVLAASAPRRHPSGDGAVRGTNRGCALLADDDPDVRHVVTGMLEFLGFDVVSCDDGGPAVERVRTTPERFALAILDMTMPQVGGRDALHGIRGVRPDLPVVCISGYSLEDAGWGAEDPPVTLLHKPFRLDALAAAIAAALTAEPGAGQGAVATGTMGEGARGGGLPGV